MKAKIAILTQQVPIDEVLSLLKLPAGTQVVHCLPIPPDPLRDPFHQRACEALVTHDSFPDVTIAELMTCL